MHKCNAFFFLVDTLFRHMWFLPQFLPFSISYCNTLWDIVKDHESSWPSPHDAFWQPLVYLLKFWRATLCKERFKKGDSKRPVKVIRLRREAELEEGMIQMGKKFREKMGGDKTSA